MIFAGHQLRDGLTIDCDLCVVGSGAGGGPVAWEAASAGLRVCVLEAGSFWQPEHMTQLEHEMFPRLYHDKAGRATRDKAIHVHQGKGVGGSTLHDINLVKRIPERIADRWRERYELEHLSADRMRALYEEVERRLSVSRLAERDLNGNNRALKRGVEALGYAGGYLQHNRNGCLASGFCELGCAFDAKENALKVYLSDAVERFEACVLADTWAERIELDGGRARAVHAVTRDPDTGAVTGKVTVRARAVCSAAGATGTPTLLARSEVPDPDSRIGSRIFLHPGAAVAGIFEDPITGWVGIPQSYECTEFLQFEDEHSDDRVWIIAAFAHPAGVSSILSGFGEAHANYLRDYPRLAALSPMVHDLTSGTVRPKGRFGVEVDYWLNAADQRAMRKGIIESVRILLAAGAQKVVVPRATTVEVRSAADLEALADLPIERHDLDLTSVHPMGSCFLGDDPATACVSSRGELHRVEGLYVADASLFPSSIGVPPQLSVYALGTHVGRSIVEDLR